MEVQEIRTEFMRLFIRSVIAHSLPLEDRSRLARIQEKLLSFQEEKRAAAVSFAEKNLVQETQQVREIMPKENVLQKTIMAKEKRVPMELPYPFIPPSGPRTPLNKTQQIPMAAPRAGAAIRRNVGMLEPVPSMQTIPKPSLSRPPTIQKIDIISLAKLDSLLNDPAVQTIECPGPGKQILVYKAGVIQTTNLSLTVEEINNVMKEISEKTRIPIISGIFKAAFGDVITTAVVSDFVGTRFIIQKKSSLQQPQAFPMQS
jgi:hypothetical protein